MKAIAILFITLSSLLAGTASAANWARPFGLTPGKTTYKEAAAGAIAQGHFKETGTSAITNGRMLESRGDGLGLPDLQKVLLIFDRDDVLQVVQLTLPKGDMQSSMFNRYNKQLSKKYRRTQFVSPFVGTRFARYKAVNAEIELEAPHMSFSMTVTYPARPPLRHALTPRARPVHHRHRLRRKGGYCSGSAKPMEDGLTGRLHPFTSSAFSFDDDDHGSFTTSDDGWMHDNDWMHNDINPANGLPMMGDIDIHGNPYGSDFNDP